MVVNKMSSEDIFYKLVEYGGDIKIFKSKDSEFMEAINSMEKQLLLILKKGNFNDKNLTKKYNHLLYTYKNTALNYNYYKSEILKLNPINEYEHKLLINIVNNINNDKKYYFNDFGSLNKFKKVLSTIGDNFYLELMHLLIYNDLIDMKEIKDRVLRNIKNHETNENLTFKQFIYQEDMSDIVSIMHRFIDDKKLDSDIMVNLYESLSQCLDKDDKIEDIWDSRSLIIELLTNNINQEYIERDYTFKRNGKTYINANRLYRVDKDLITEDIIDDTIKNSLIVSNFKKLNNISLFENHKLELKETLSNMLNKIEFITLFRGSKDEFICYNSAFEEYSILTSNNKYFNSESLKYFIQKLFSNMFEVDMDEMKLIFDKEIKKIIYKKNII